MASDRAPSAAQRSVSVVLAGGGTAGHTSPLIATAHELLALEPSVRITAVGTARGLETTVVPAAGLTLELIPPVPLPRQLGADLVKVPARLAGSVRAAARILRQVQATVVLGFGGYVSTPVYLAARATRVPVVIHEQNALPGLANRLAARFAHRVFTSFPVTRLPAAVCIGLPLRRAITDLDRPAQQALARRSFGLRADLATLLVSGGSQGAVSINTAVQQAQAPLLAAGVQVLHVLGPRNADTAKAAVDLSTGASYQPLAYVERMEQAYAAADLMLARCGASTVLETAAVGLPAVFVPYPHGNGEQRRNAQLVVDAGGGELLDDARCTGTWVRERIPALLRDPDRLAGMSRALAGVGVRDAATRLAQQTLEVARPWA
jgi:UDP-N-acetylglucosamine--N-acetylmuramyl-(pentapeptide) pyrophosphoryl-undecaprenol N-acetylglucosamine transferase